jgi:hypothetical protein
MGTEQNKLLFFAPLEYLKITTWIEDFQKLLYALYHSCITTDFIQAYFRSPQYY